VTATGLGEAARRIKSGEDCAAYRFEGGETDYAVARLRIDHGRSEERYGQYSVRNHWRLQGLVYHALASGPAIAS
jgi:hypothetical protein